MGGGGGGARSIVPDCHATLPSTPSPNPAGARREGRSVRGSLRDARARGAGGGTRPTDARCRPTAAPNPAPRSPQGDVNEFNQCQTQLIDLHRRGLGSRSAREEFAAYHVLYLIYTRNDTDIRHRHSHSHRHSHRRLPTSTLPHRSPQTLDAPLTLDAPPRLATPLSVPTADASSVRARRRHRARSLGGCQARCDC